MYCSVCGQAVLENQPTCPRCGRAVYAQPAPFSTCGYRVHRHIQPLAVLWLVSAALSAVGGLIAIMVLMGVFGHWGHGWPLHGGYGGAFGPFGVFPFVNQAAWIVPLVVTITLVRVGLSCLAGFALMRRVSWGRTAAIIVGVLALLRPILGTLLGIYTLWVLAPSAAGAEYEQMVEM